MARINWSGNGEKREMEPGIYLAAVMACGEETSKKGDLYFNPHLVAVEFENAHLCYDAIMLSGPGLDMGLAKLTALGFSKDNGDEIEAEALVGRRAWVALKLDTYQDRTRLQVDAKVKGSHCGYWPETAPPPAGAKRPVAAEAPAAAADEFASPAPAPALAKPAAPRRAAKPKAPEPAAAPAAGEDEVPF